MGGKGGGKAPEPAPAPVDPGPNPYVEMMIAQQAANAQRDNAQMMANAESMQGSAPSQQQIVGGGMQGGSVQGSGMQSGGMAPQQQPGMHPAQQQEQVGLEEQQRPIKDVWATIEALRGA